MSVGEILPKTSSIWNYKHGQMTQNSYFTVNWWKTKKKRFTITENFAIYLNIAMDYDFSKFENDITFESGL